MNADVSIVITKDTASGTLKNLQLIFSKTSFQMEVASRCVALTANHIRGLPTNKQGWPSTGFYKAVSGNVTAVQSDGGFSVLVDHPEKKGAMRQRYHGGTIRMKDKLLTIPARQEFYGRKATDFSDLRFVMFASGTKALMIGVKGAGLVNFTTGRSGNPRGAGARERGMVAYWLKESVTQEGDHGVVPSNDEYLNVIKSAFVEAVAEVKGAKR